MYCSSGTVTSFAQLHTSESRFLQQGKSYEHHLRPVQWPMIHCEPELESGHSAREAYRVLTRLSHSLLFAVHN